ncbi:MAG: hypothetical protein LBF64_06105 [Oscillospiraceae bacterium]|jgi:shikimate kinase|nr:hypothetical protein [Oscillospiraceae bacterium]
MIYMNHIILIGPPNSGKTTLGKRAAEAMDISFYDTDEMVTDKIELGHPINLFRPSFQQRFYEGQIDVIVDLAMLKVPAIIATGAEVPLIPQCALILRQMGTVIFIKRDMQLLLAGLSKRTHRFILKEKKSGLEIDMSAKAVEEYVKETKNYEKMAHEIFENNGDEESAVVEFTEFLKGLYSGQPS